ncbi:MAG: hypothetical protein LBG52_08850 [Candidatus Peribacteria bacterium]|jgi:hypothetical protein|nr:hypothetical protein [Candidatus Peribacteria bacterium]
MTKTILVWSKISIVILSSILLFYLFCLNFVNPTEIGIARNIITGETHLQDGNGWNLTVPWVFVPIIDTRPIRVEVSSAGHGISAKLVQFNKQYWEEFVLTEGIYYYWWANRISFNLGYDEEHRGMKDILRGYAYSPKKYNYLSVLNEYAE